MNEVQVYSKSFNAIMCNVRAFNINGKVWFVGKDVAEGLGYKDTDQAIRNHCKQTKVYPVETTGQVRNMTVINEYDIIRLIMKSRLPEAEKFEKWIVEEVVPSVLSTGSYSIMNKPTTAIQNYLNMSEAEKGIAYFTALKENEEKQVLIEQQQKQLDDQQEDVNYSKAMNRAINSDMLISDFARFIGYGPQKIFDFLKDSKHKYLFDRGKSKNGRNIPLQIYIDKGYFVRVPDVINVKGAEVTTYTTKITFEGQKFIVNKHPELVKKRDVLDYYKDEK